MKLVKVLKVIEPADDGRGYINRWATYKVTIDFGDGKIFDSYLCRDEYKVFVAEQKLLALGVDAKLLEEYGDGKHSLGYEAGAESELTDD